MWLRVLAFAACFALTTNLTTYAQRGGGGRGGGVGGSQRQPTTGQPGGSAQARPGLSNEQRQRIRASEKQREQYRLATQAINRVRTRAREMVRAARADRFSFEQFRAQYVELRNEFQLMQEEHERLTAELSEEQRAATQDRNGEIEKDLEEIDVWIQAMDDELKESSPEPKKLADHSRKIEKAVKELEGEHRRLASDLSID